MSKHFAALLIMSYIITLIVHEMKLFLDL